MWYDMLEEVGGGSLRNQHRAISWIYLYYLHTGQSYYPAKHNHHQATGSYGPRREKTCLRGFANNTGADQPAHPRSLISAFVIRFVESIICKLGTGEISIFWLVPVAEETGLKFALSETPKTGLVTTRPVWIL